MGPDGILETESGAIVWPDLIRFVVDAGWSGLEHYAGHAAAFPR